MRIYLKIIVLTAYYVDKQNKFMKTLFRQLSILTLFLSFTALSAQFVVPTKAEEFEKVKAKNRMSQKSAPQTADYDVNYYHIKLDLDPNVRYVDGSVTTYFTVQVPTLNSIFFDLDAQLNVDSVRYHNTTYTNHLRSGFNTVEFPFPTALANGTLDSLTIFYKGTPPGPATGTPFARVNIAGGDLIWTLSEPYGAQDWWPCKNDLTDKADSISMTIGVPLGNKVAAIGLLNKIDTVSSTEVYHWKTTYPTVAYLVAFGAGNYDFYEEVYPLNNDSILMHHFLYSNQTQAQSTVGILPFMQLFDSLFGEYPFIEEKYGHASFTFGGGMEHQTMSFMGGYGGGLKAHELAHQWFGNKITCGSWKDLWLNEGFATYLTGLTYQFGKGGHPKSLWQTWLSQAESGSRTFPHGAVYRTGTDTNNVGTLFNGQVYNKGAITLHTLRWAIGDSAFFAGTRNYINDPALIYGFAKTTDLQQHMEASSGRNLQEFFDDWVYGKGYPEFRTRWGQTGNQFDINIEQIPTDTSVSFFNIPVPYQLTGPNLDTIIVLDPSTNIQTFTLNINKTVNNVVFDPRNDIFAEETFTVVGLNELQEKESKIMVAPNPTNGTINIIKNDAFDAKTITIYSTKGSIVYTGAFQRELNLNELNSGLYILELRSDSNVSRTKIIKN